MKISSSNQPTIFQPRRYEVDWLRTLAFMLLIFYHIGMYYVADWSWHIKSQHQSELLQYFMLLVNQWRMPLIFFISGLVLSLVEPKVNTMELLKLRFFRVFLPLVIGMYLIVPPQAYYEAVVKLDYTGSFVAFWLEYIYPSTGLLPEMHHSELGLLTWNHLWYLMYLWVYTLAYLAIKPILIRIGIRFKHSTPSKFLIFCFPIVALTTMGLFLQPLYPKTNALFDDLYNHGIYFSVFLFGYFTAKSDGAWQTIINYRRLWIMSAILSYLTLMMINKTDWFSLNGYMADKFLHVLVYTNLWSWLLTVVSYAGACLNRPSERLRYLNQAILPWYILHQTVIIVIAVQLKPLALGGLYEPVLLVAGTFAMCAALYSIIQRWNILRFMFGMTLKP